MKATTVVTRGRWHRTKDDDERETLEMLERSCRLRGLPLPYRLAIRLEQLRRGSGSAGVQ